MENKSILGCLYGDEGKAKIVDVLASEMDIIVRFQGGSNAGHTIQFEGNKYILHLIPSGIFHQEKICILSAGVVIDPFQLENEMNQLKTHSISFDKRFFIDERASLVLPIHKYLDEKNENLSSDKKIGTTKRGIGPCYSDIINRISIKIYNLKDKKTLRDKIEYLYKFHGLDNMKMENEIPDLIDKLYNFGQEMKNCFVNLPYVINSYIKDDKKILFEGAQGSLLDVYFGTYPYVTSSHTIAGGIASAIGISPKYTGKIIGLYKSYFTRVGEGPFPTELLDETGETIRKQGNEFGSTTGRARRCGWFDAVSAKFSAMINGIDEIALTLLDVLSGFDTLKICIAYDIDGVIYKEFPADTSLLYQAKPIYIELAGWNEDISNCRNLNDLPINTQIYLKKIEELLMVPIKIISIGPNREQTIFVK